MPSIIKLSMPNRLEILKHQYQNSIGLPFAPVLSEAAIAAVLSEQGVRYRQVLYTPIVVIWAWLSQVLDEDSSLSQAVKRVVTWLVVAGQEPPSHNTGGYSKARQRLPLSVLPPLLAHSAEQLQGQVKPSQRWCGRPVKAFDATTVLMSDTEANQAQYPQHGLQKAGCGFPILKLVVWFCITTGAVLAVNIAPYRVSEWRLARDLYAQLKAEDVVVADSAYGTYVDLAWVALAGADGVFRKHYGRQCDFRRGRSLGKGDHIVQWQRPETCPKALSREEFNALPPTLDVREVKLTIAIAGFRPTQLILVTTLKDPKRYPKACLAELYHIRWQAAEVNLKHLKTTLNMDMIAAKTPTMVLKSLWIHLLAYNCLRWVMWQAVDDPPLSALRLSLKGTRQQWNHFRPFLAQAAMDTWQPLYDGLLAAVATLKVPLRPHRSEPRVVKRRAKAFPKMQQPRSVLKAQLVS